MAKDGPTQIDCALFVRSNRRKVRRWFRKEFPKRHKESIRGILEECLAVCANQKSCTSRLETILNQMHPAAIQLLMEYGLDHQISRWKKPTDLEEPERGGCFRNSWLLLHQHEHNRVRFLEKNPGATMTPLYYAEGITAGAMVMPMLHAWVTAAAKNESNIMLATDWTLYSIFRWNRYFGIHLTIEEYYKVRDESQIGKDYVALLFDKNHYTLEADKVLRKILESRREAAA